MARSAAPERLRALGLTALVALVYALAGKLGLSLAFVNASASAVWPPTGIAIAAVLILGRVALPGIFAGAFIVNATTTGATWSSLAIAVGNTLEAFVAMTLVQRFAGGASAFESPRGALRFMVLAGGVATAVSATVGVAALLAAGLVDAATAPTVWLTWWLGDMAGALVLAPPIVLWARREGLPSGRGLAEFALFGLASLALGSMIFLGGAAQARPLAFLCIPPVVWAAYRLGQREASTLTVAIGALAVVGTVRGIGPFARADPNEALLLLTVFLAIVVLLALPLGAIASERRAALRALERAASELEARVEERTRELRESQRRFAGFMSNLPGLAWVKDARGAYVFSNESFARTLDRSPTDMIGRTDADLFPATLAEEYRANDATVRATQATLSTVERQVVGGQMRYSVVSKFLIPQEEREDGALIGGVAVDITERMRAQQRLAQAERIAHFGSFEWDHAAGAMTASDELRRMLGFDPTAPLTIDRFLDRIHPVDRDRVARTLEAAGPKAPGIALRARALLPDGGVRVLDIVGAADAGDGELAARFVGSCHDVTDQALAEDEARRSLVTRKLVRRVLHDLAQAGASQRDRRELGRGLASETSTMRIEDGLEAFASMGIGELAVRAAKDGRYVFEGADLIERTDGVQHPTCYVALGYLEETVARVTGSSALGAETSCQSQGHARCTFIVRARPNH